MARGVNKVILIGNVGQDPDVRSLPSGVAVTNITLATSESWKDKTTGNLEERTEWHKVVFFDRLAEIVREYVRKGSKIYIEGSLRTRKYQKSGVDVYSTEIVASSMQLLDSRQSSEPAPAAAPQRRGIIPAPAAPQGDIDFGNPGFEDDEIPF